jgi:hypothetical protein
MNEQVKERKPSTADLAGMPQSGEEQPAMKQTTATQPAMLFPNNESDNFRSRWNAIQTGFVDEPRHAVEEADALVAEVMKRLAKIFADERANLEGQWGRGDNVSTEDLRITLQRYRSFFDRLLSL